MPRESAHTAAGDPAWTQASARRYAFGVAKRSRKHLIAATAAAALAVLGGAAALKHCLYTGGCGSSESKAVAHMIRGAEEAYFAEHERYLDVSTSNSLYPGPGTARMAFDNPQHPDSARWQQLSINPDGPVHCGYAVRAGAAGDALPAELPSALSRPARKTMPWYVVRTMCVSPEGKKELWTASWTQEWWENAR